MLRCYPESTKQITLRSKEIEVIPFQLQLQRESTMAHGSAMGHWSKAQGEKAK